MNLLPERFPVLFRGVSLDPLAVDLWLSWTAFVKLSPNFTVDPITREDGRNDFSEAPASCHRQEVTRVGLRDGPFGEAIELLRRETNGFTKAGMEMTLYFDGDQRVAREDFQGLQIRRFRAAMTENLRKVQ